MTAPVAPGSIFGSWSVVATDPTGKRATCQCRCGRVRQVAIAALESGESTSCGCSPMTPAQGAALRDEVARQRRLRDLGPR